MSGVAPSNSEQHLATHSNSLAGKTNDLRRGELLLHFYSNSGNSSLAAGKLRFSVLKVAKGADFRFLTATLLAQLLTPRQFHFIDKQPY